MCYPLTETRTQIRSKIQRGNVMRKMEASPLADLVRISFTDSAGTTSL